MVELLALLAVAVAGHLFGRCGWLETSWLFTS